MRKKDDNRMYASTRWPAEAVAVLITHLKINMKKYDLKEIAELTCRLYVFVFLTLYGVAKLIGGQFYTPASLPLEVAEIPIGQVPNFELAWTFMGRSFGYMAFIGIGEMLGAVLLLFNRTKLIGVGILVPIMVNVIVFDIFFLVAYGALASATIYFLMLITILWINKERVIQAWNNLTDLETKKPLKEKLILYGASVLLMALLFFIDQSFVNWLGHGKG